MRATRHSLRRRFGMVASARHFAREDAGNLSIELGLLAPVMILFIFAVAEGGHLLWTVNALHYSVQEAARCASVDATTCHTATQIESFAAGIFEHERRLSGLLGEFERPNRPSRVQFIPERVFVLHFSQGLPSRTDGSRS